MIKEEMKILLSSFLLNRMVEIIVETFLWKGLFSTMLLGPILKSFPVSKHRDYRNTLSAKCDLTVMAGEYIENTWNDLKNLYRPLLVVATRRMMTVAA
jgi:hypothetical protein